MSRLYLLGVLGLLAAASGCMSPYYADRGALFGGLTGAGLGAIVGNSVGNTAAGAAIGAGAGALTGAAIGGAIDDVDARNRARIEAQMGHPVAAGSVTPQDVISMTHAGVDPDLIANHVRAHGAIAPPTSGDLIRLQQAGVDKRVIEAMQTSYPPPQVVQAVAPAPVIIEEHYYARPYYYPSYGFHYHHCRPRPRTSFGIAVSR